MKSLYRIPVIALLLSSAVASAQDPIIESQQTAQLEKALEQLSTLISDAPSRYHHDRAGVLFRLGRFEESIQDYDSAVQYAWPHDNDSCWERGLAQYYAGKFREGKEQFERYHEVGPLDIENGLWRLLCTAEDDGLETAREAMLDYPRKMRKPFPALLALYMDHGDADAVLKEAQDGVTAEEERTANLFNAHYYIAKYYEIIDQHDRALIHIRIALEHRFPHFMYYCAEIDARRLESFDVPEQRQIDRAE